MTRKYLKFIVTALALSLTADAALAQFLPAPFGFTFFTQGLVEFFLLPLSLAGCL